MTKTNYEIERVKILEEIKKLTEELIGLESQRVINLKEGIGGCEDCEYLKEMKTEEYSIIYMCQGGEKNF